MSSSDYIALAAIIVSIASFFYTYSTNTKKYEIFNQYRNEVLCWYHETTEILVRLKLEAKQESNDYEVRRDLLSKLSAKIEKGCFYFPNIDKGDGFGAEKPLSYRGYRNVILDFLVFSFRLFEKDDASSYLNHAEILQRHFTSSIYEVINPKRFLKDTEKHTEQILSNNATFEYFIDKEPELLRTYIKSYN